jgi:hypothetical protein
VQEQLRSRRPLIESIQERQMYDMYPEWGPTSQAVPPWAVQPDNQAAVQASLDLRDNGGERPDDN